MEVALQDERSKLQYGSKHGRDAVRNLVWQHIGQASVALVYGGDVGGFVIEAVNGRIFCAPDGTYLRTESDS